MSRGRAKKRPSGVAPGDLEILSLLWEYGPLTLAEAHARFERPLGYTTVQTRLNRLVDKGLVRRSSDRPARYEAAVTREAISEEALRTLRERVAGGSVVPLVARLLDDPQLSASELKELKELLKQAEARVQRERRR